MFAVFSEKVIFRRFSQDRNLRSTRDDVASNSNLKMRSPCEIVVAFDDHHMLRLFSGIRNGGQLVKILH